MNNNKISSTKRNRIQRLQTRMENYRKRSKQQETIHNKRTDSDRGSNPSGFNLFCREFQSGMNQAAKSDYLHNISFDETFLDPNPGFENNLHNSEIFMESGASNLNGSGSKSSENNVKLDSIEVNNNNVKSPSLCWICGELCGSNQELLQHASSLHFSDWLADNSYWDVNEMLQLRYNWIVN